MRFTWLAGLLLAGCSMTSGGDLKGLADDKYHGCGGGAYLAAAGAYILHIGDIPQGATLKVVTTPNSCEFTLTMPGAATPNNGTIVTGPTTINQTPPAK